MALPTRSIVFCVCDSDCESNATAYSWALAHLFEPRDSLTFLFCRVQPTLTRTMHSQNVPLWSWRFLSLEPFAAPPVFVEVTSAESVESSAAAFARAAAPRILLLGSRGATGIARLVAGSVAGAVVESSPAPCLVVSSGRPRAPLPISGTDAVPLVYYGAADASSSKGGRHAPRRIGIAVDASEAAGPALCAWSAAWLLRPTDVVTLLHARAGCSDDGSAGVVPPLDRAVAALVAATDAASGAGTVGEAAAKLPCAAEALAGADAGAALVSWAHDSDATLLVVGSRGVTGLLQRLTLGSVSAFVLQRAPCPVLVVDVGTVAAYSHARVQSRHETQAA